MSPSANSKISVSTGAIGKSEEARIVLGGDTAPLEADLEATGIDLASFLIVSDCR